MARIEPLTNVDLWPPDLSAWASGNGGPSFVHRFDSSVPGPHVVVNALMHGNEYSGAIAAATMLAAGIRPWRGILSFSFANIEAFGQFDPGFPVMSRYVDEDMNRVWSPQSLAAGVASVERQRARELWPLFATADRVLDLHSMQHDRIPLMLCGRSGRGRDFARRVGLPGIIVADGGHAGGSRLIDHPRFTEGAEGPVALLAECGQHWDPASAVTALSVTARFLLAAGIVDAAALSPWLPSDDPPPPRLVEVTETVTVGTERFRFLKEYQGMDVIPTAGTVFAMDGEVPVHTPHDDCVLIMPSRSQAERGHTAVRLGRFVA
ncbi:succinylglutamate desuccinylase/aspartoacylase family protein [Niveispirillum sp.]|uniref:succinylglutamate desuccinylase/aspartoacylase domain-containing protein n=1 Tax=Niveispirillum sp. TaxID=1917217 RepID=UPI0025FE8B7A|nr:succinylglutamate desuccinylase/aspartoacylase family protein [Niveispirillum sp.]